MVNRRLESRAVIFFQDYKATYHKKKLLYRVEPLLEKTCPLQAKLSSWRARPLLHELACQALLLRCDNMHC